MTALVLTTIGEVLGAAAQIGLIFIGAGILWFETGPNAIAARLLWCIVASVYLGATVLALNVLARSPAPDNVATRILVGHPVSRFLATLVTFGSSLIGLSVALELISKLGRKQYEPLDEASAVWAMLLSWALFNWGFARIYFSRYHRASEISLEFPNTPKPKLVDFAYFAFTNATTFAVSDVKVLTTRMRWTVVWHTSMAFFFNALIIVLTMNVIAQGRLLSTLFD
ncbi:DUF1345 domain-containing protein [Leucobacter sp. CSA2]|uniref:DUF1345 domain-containing protein n=1 Tax=Leucobacter edaphi TaxID=2796472 RepID=A0A934UXZ9_9MICO|nr:DUF1345 domain-containing protein [Leucobacter edaphi]